MQSDGDYAYAKACGILGKSFLGKRLKHLEGLHSLGELDRLVFFNSYSENQMEQRELLGSIEKRIIQRAVHQILSVVDSYSAPPDIFIRLLRAYEYYDLKTCCHLIASGKKEMPDFCDIGRFSHISFRHFPNLDAMFKNTEFEFLISDFKQIRIGNMNIQQLDVKIDSHYYNTLSNSIVNLSPQNSMIIKRILGDEIALRNCIWALRVRAYYQKKAVEAQEYLLDIKLGERSLSLDAFNSLHLPLDSRISWENWKWKNFLNPEEGQGHWKVDPRYFQNAASNYLSRLAMSYFHSMPLEISSIFCFIKLKQIEEDLLTSIAEGLALGMESSSVFDILGMKMQEAV